jgi:cell division septation protein DedD
MRDYEEKSYYEIQLDNKQLILVFLSGLVLCVLIFVLGVMVGKGQKEAEIAAMPTARPEGQMAKNEPEVKTPEQPKQNMQMDEKVPPAPKTTQKSIEKHAGAAEKATGVSPKKATRTATEQYSFYDLDKKDSSNNDLEKPDTKTDSAAAPSKNANTVDSTENNQKAGGIEYTVQVMATASKTKADEELTTLRARGYKPFLDQYKTQSGVVYKVRIGKFTDSSAARALASKLKQEMKLEPWVAVLD